MNDLTLPEAHQMVMRDVDDLVKKMMELEQADCPVLHFFHDGIYIREVRFPAGVLAIGHIQKYAQMNVFIRGCVMMLNPDGTTTELVAPMTFVGGPGRKVGHVIEEVIWQNVYPNPDNERNVEVLEARWLEQTPYFEDFKQTRLLASPDNDFQKMLDDLGVTTEQVAAESSITDDLIDMPSPWVKVAVRSSQIHGMGLFAETNLTKNEVICPMRIDGKRTPAGRYANHSGTPNAKAVRMFDSDLGLVALRDIHGRRGGFNGEEITVDYRQVKEVV